MVRYRFARSAGGALVDAVALAGSSDQASYRCLSCEGPLVAKVNGTIRRPHFSHKADAECSGESYLHRLAKLAFIQTYRECLASGVPFEIELDRKVTCGRYERLLGENRHCATDRVVFDLTRFYSDVRLETRSDEFVPDVSLHRGSRPDDVIFIEIAVSHFLSERKEKSGHRIIEIPIRSEEDIGPILQRRISPEVARFLGFAPREQRVAESECVCGPRQVLVFHVLKTGRVRLRKSTFGSVDYLLRRLIRDEVLHTALVAVPDEEIDSEILRGILRAEIFWKQVRLAFEQGVAIRNCYLCRYHAENRFGEPGKPIFCKTYRKACGSNEAVECDRYRPERQT